MEQQPPQLPEGDQAQPPMPLQTAPEREHIDRPVPTAEWPRTDPPPRIWVGSLSDYNSGVLHGRWVGAARETADVEADVQTMLGRSPTARRTGQPAEEWGIFDYEGFGNYRLGEYDPIPEITALARRIRDYGLAFAAWASLAEGDPDHHSHFHDAYLGHYDSLHDYVVLCVEAAGYDQLLDKAVPPSLRPYVDIDIAGLARDLELSGDVRVVNNRHGGVWVFNGQIP